MLKIVINKNNFNQVTIWKFSNNLYKVMYRDLKNVYYTRKYNLDTFKIYNIEIYDDKDLIFDFYNVNQESYKPSDMFYMNNINIRYTKNDIIELFENMVSKSDIKSIFEKNTKYFTKHLPPELVEIVEKHIDIDEYI